MADIPTHSTFRNLLHQPFERLTVVDFHGYVQMKANRPYPMWVCDCSCGTKGILVDAQSLMKLHTRSCGCLQKEATVRMGHRNRTHGKRHVPEYNVWAKMIRRCTDNSDPAYGNYGGRGITVCAEWMDFGVFIADMGSRPSRTHSIDRFPDNDGPYCKANCRWATALQQARNKRNNILMTYNGVTRTLPEWAEIVGINKGTLMSRRKYGWSDERCLTTPARHLSNHF